MSVATITEHHYMEVGMLEGIKERAEGRLVAA